MVVGYWLLIGGEGSHDLTGSDVIQHGGRKSRGLGWETADRWENGIAGSGDRKSRDFGVGNRWVVGKTAGSDPKKTKRRHVEKNHMVLIPFVLQAGTLRVPEFKVQTGDCECPRRPGIRKDTFETWWDQ